MLCNACNKHFSYSDVRTYLRLKADAIALLRTHEAPPDGLRALEFDLRRYQAAVDSSQPSVPPCPWYIGDLAILPPSLLSKVSRHDCEIPIWSEERPGKDAVNSASTGCEICVRLCEIISNIPKLSDPGSVTLESWLEMHPISLKPSALRFLIQSGIDHEWISFNVIGDDGEPRFRRPAGTSTDDEACFESLSRAFANCLALHDICRPENQDHWSPSRLLDVSRTSATGDFVHLIERTDLHTLFPRSNIEYLTLSHTWGRERFLTLTRTNFEDIKHGVSVAELPRCFQDAIAVTRRLGVRYLWIDSLCIIQDSIDDWSAEAAMMDRVYEHGLCNLAACNATDPSIGLFSMRDVHASGSFLITLAWPDYTTSFTVFFDWFHIINDHAPLNQRAWVEQERLLSPRTMHFSKFPFWECRKAVTCELYPSEVFSMRYDGLSGTHKLCLDSSTSRPREIWNDIIHSYSRCKLTKESDKLIALSGIAKTISPGFGGRYLAGTWYDSLLPGLLWQIAKFLTGNTLFSIRTDQYVAPSWSWASVEGPIDPFEHDALQPLVNVLSADVKPATQNPFGQVVGGELRLRGVLFRTPHLGALVEDRERYREEVRFDDWALSLDDCRDHYYDQETFFLPLGVSPEASRRPELTICGILVQQEGSDKFHRSVFSRVGFCIVAEDGEIANSGWYLQDWIPRPWPEKREGEIIVV